MELAWKYVEYAGNHLLKVILKDINKLTWKGRIIMKKRIEIKSISGDVLFGLDKRNNTVNYPRTKDLWDFLLKMH